MFLQQIRLLPCIYKEIFGFECPTCGFQRAIILLINGHIGESIALYPALIPLLILGICYLSYRITNRPGIKIIKFMLVFSLALVFGSYAWKMIFSVACDC